MKTSRRASSNAYTSRFSEQERLHFSFLLLSNSQVHRGPFCTLPLSSLFVSGFHLSSLRTSRPISLEHSLPLVAETGRRPIFQYRPPADCTQLVPQRLRRLREHFSKMHFSKMHFSKMHFSKILQIFGGLVLGCIKTKFCKKICVRQHFSSSTRFASFCTAAISKFSQKNRFEKSAIFVKFQQKFCKCRKICKMLPNFKIFS